MSVNIVDKSTGNLTKIAGNPIEQASGISYDHTSSGMQANNVQAAVDELKSGLTNVQSDVKLNTQDLTTVSRSKNNIVMTVESVKRGNTSGTWNGNTYTKGNLTYELLTDDGVVINGINVSGNNSEYANFNLCASLNLGAGRYTLSQQDNLSNDSCYTTVSTDGSYKAWASGHHGSESYDSISGLCTFTLVCHNFNSANPVTIYPMNRISTETDPTFAPYVPSVESRIEAVESGLTNCVTIEKHSLNPNASFSIALETTKLYNIEFTSINNQSVYNYYKYAIRYVSGSWNLCEISKIEKNADYVALSFVITDNNLVVTVTGGWGVVVMCQIASILL